MPKSKSRSTSVSRSPSTCVYLCLHLLFHKGTRAPLTLSAIPAPVFPGKPGGREEQGCEDPRYRRPRAAARHPQLSWPQRPRPPSAPCADPGLIHQPRPLHSRRETRDPWTLSCCGRAQAHPREEAGGSRQSRAGEEAWGVPPLLPAFHFCQGVPRTGPGSPGLPSPSCWVSRPRRPLLVPAACGCPAAAAHSATSCLWSRPAAPPRLPI